MTTTTTTTTDEDEDMKKLMAKWEEENNVEDASDSNVDDEDDEPEGYDDLLEKYRRDVKVTNNALDHIILGTNNLESAMEKFEQMTGVMPLMVVSHNGLGTKSARVAFETCAFLEIIGPDPKQDGTFPMAEKLSKIPDGQMVPVHYAIRNNQASELQNTVWKEKLGLGCDQVTMIAKDRGMPWKWSMYFLEDHDADGLVPFFIDWGDAHHAAGRLPIVGQLEHVKVRSDGLPILQELLDDVQDVQMDTGSSDESFEMMFTSPKGKHTFSGSKLIGISFPK